MAPGAKEKPLYIYAHQQQTEPMISFLKKIQSFIRTAGYRLILLLGSAWGGGFGSRGGGGGRAKTKQGGTSSFGSFLLSATWLHAFAFGGLDGISPWFW